MATTKIIPTENYLLLQFVDKEAETESKLIVPDLAKQKSVFARIVELGHNSKGKFTVGQQVIIQTGGLEFKFEGESYILLHADYVLAKIGQ